MIYDYKDLTKYDKTKIRNLDTKWLTHIQITKKLWISCSVIDYYLHKHKTSKIIDWNKRCIKCWDWFENTTEYFSPSWYKQKDWSPSLRRDCKICRWWQARKDRIDKTIVVLKMNLKNSVKRRIKRIMFWNTRRLSMSPERKKKIKKCNIRRKALAAERLQTLIDNKRKDYAKSTINSI